MMTEAGTAGGTVRGQDPPGPAGSARQQADTARIARLTGPDRRVPATERTARRALAGPRSCSASPTSAPSPAVCDQRTPPPTAGASDTHPAPYGVSLIRVRWYVTGAVRAIGEDRTSARPHRGRGPAGSFEPPARPNAGPARDVGARHGSVPDQGRCRIQATDEQMGTIRPSVASIESAAARRRIRRAEGGCAWTCGTSARLGTRGASYASTACFVD